MEDQDESGGSKDKGGTRGKQEPCGAKEVEGSGAAGGLEIHGETRVTPDQGRARGKSIWWHMRDDKPQWS